MPSRFLNNITVNDEYTLPSADGAADQIITTDGAGQLGFVDQSTINAGNAEHVVIYAKNTHTASIAKGTPVYITGTVGATDTVEIAPADAGNSAKMPAVGLLDATLAVNAFGYVITGGFMDNITTDPIDGITPTSNDTVYVKVGGGLTLTKPTGPTGLIQNVAKVGKVSGGNAGSLIVSSILRTNDVPNLTTGKIWVGDGNTVESTVVHLDEVNERMGIGTTSPSHKLQINGTTGIRNSMTSQPTYGYANVGAGDFVVGGNSIYPGVITLYNQDTTISAGQDLGVIQFVGKDDLSTGYASSMIKGSAQGAAGTGNSGGGILSFLTSAGYGNPSERMRIINNGDVGIGTTSPTSKLHVTDSAPVLKLQSSSNTSSTVSFDNSSGTRRASLSFNETSDYLSLKNESGSGLVGFTSSQGEFTIGSFAQTGVIINNTSLTLKSNYSTALTCDFAGRVGIGTTSPSAKLEVNGDIAVSGDNNVYSEGDTLTLMAGGTGGTYLMVNDLDGGVGIGTTSPSHALDVVGSAQITNDIYLGRYMFHDNDTNTWIGFPSNDTISFRTNGSDRMYINSSGNVGIGTNSPGEKLEVDGHIKAVDGYKGYVSHFHSGGFDHIPKSSDGANPFWIPSNYIVDATVNQYYNIWVPLYAGRIRKIIFKNTTGTPTATVCTFYKRINGTTSGTTYAGTVTGGGASGMKVTVDFGTSNFTFNAEDEIQIGFVTGVATQPPLRGVSYQIWYEYNIT